MPPILYIKNTLRLAEMGLGDGTLYAWTAASAIASQADRTFDLSPLTRILDLPTLTDDDINGYLLYFPASGNRYHIVDFVAGTEVVTTWEVPQTIDSGSCEIRRSLLDTQALPGNPAFRLSDGQKALDWKSTPNNTIEIHLENKITNGGFESSALPPWVKSSIGGGTDGTGVNATSPMLGKYDLLLDLGGRTSVTVEQNILEMKKNTTHRLLFKARHTGAFSPDLFELKFTKNGVDFVLSNPSTGSVSGAAFRPTLTTANTWYFVDVTTPNWDTSNAVLQLNITGTFDVNIDEIYLFEKVAVDSLLLFDHNSPFSITDVTGRNTAKGRTGAVVGEDFLQLKTADTITGGDAAIVSLTSGIYPVYTIATTDLIQASEILLCEKWALPYAPILPFEPDETSYNESVFTSRSGVEQVILHFKRAIRSGTFEGLADLDQARYFNDWLQHHRAGGKHPFAIQWENGDPPILMIDDSKNSGLNFNNLKPDWAFKFKEIVG